MNENFRISIRRQQVRVCVDKTQTETVSNPFSKQPEFIALQGAIHDFTNLKQDFNLKGGKIESLD